MMYRVVEKDDGYFYLQYRMFFIFWLDSMFPATTSKEMQIILAKRRMIADKIPKIVKVVWL